MGGGGGSKRGRVDVGGQAPSIFTFTPRYGDRYVCCEPQVGREPRVWFPFRKEWGDVGGKAPFILTLTPRLGIGRFVANYR